MSDKSTPGPYAYNRDAVNKTWRIIGADGYGAIAQVFTEANAVQIAAALNKKSIARDLLEALQLIHIESLPDDVQWYVRAAIAKATGAQS